MKKDKMRVGVYPFQGSADIGGNTHKILHAIEEAAEAGVRMLVFQECALWGYPPLERPCVTADALKEQESCLEKICCAAQAHRLYIAVGMIRPVEGGHCNSICLISPMGDIMGYYDKRALWGWDVDNFVAGTQKGVFEIDGFSVAFRICYDIRFPECFADCFCGNVPLCFVSFCDVQAVDSPERYETMRGHLSTRAVENVMTVVSVDSLSAYQTAPTGVFDPDGNMVAEAVKNREGLLVFDFEEAEPSFGQRGRLENRKRLMESQ